ncbi:hypothetical protein [Lichenicoccus sp.]|uniref:hypothetical protein n=1 Tax=Lichenicoccus sp. TaxID=2781899 RepID=UPI003D127591
MAMELGSLESDDTARPSLEAGITAAGCDAPDVTRQASKTPDMLCKSAANRQQ